MDDGEETRGQDQQRQNNADAPLAPAVALPTLNPNEPHGEDVHNGPGQEPKEPVNWFRNADWWMVLLTALLFGVGAITLRVFYRQFKEMQIQTGILNTQAKQSAADAVESAKKVEAQLAIAREQTKATQNSARAIQRQMRVDQRAWIKIDRRSEQFVFTEGKPIEIPIRFINTGKTPALKLSAKIIVDIIKNGESPDFLSLSKKDYRPGTGFYTGIVYPGIPHDITATMQRRVTPERDEPEPISHSMYTDLHSGKTYWAVHGIATYDDIFGVSHWVQFCAWMFDAPGPFTSAKCVAYNKVDNN